MFFVGVVVGTVAFIMEEIEEVLAELASHFMRLPALESLGPTKAFCAAISIGCAYGLIAGLLTTYWGPGAAGSGVAELIGYLNGVNYKDFLGIKTLITKILGVVLAVNARLCVGKEGPLAHIGANLGAMVPYIPGMGFEFLRNDEKKRQFIAAGASVGVSAAFGAPVGGALFCFELSKPNTFWRFELLYKVFFACCIGTFCLGLEKHIFTARGENFMRASDIKFGYAHFGAIPHVRLFPHTVALAFMTGTSGALFLFINAKVNELRKRFLTSRWILPVETVALAFLTGAVFFWYPYYDAKCLALSQHEVFGQVEDEYGDAEVELDEMFSAFCTDKFYSTAGGHLKPH